MEEECPICEYEYESHDDQGGEVTSCPWNAPAALPLAWVNGRHEAS